jgi:hypothetical protein
MQTNGTLLDDEWCEFFRAHNMLVGLSMDGPPQMHDAYRVDKGGKPTHHRVLAAAQLLARHHVDVNILCTVNARNSDHPLEVYRYLRDELGARYLQFIPIVERATAQSLPLANQGWGHRATDRPLYRQEGSLVTDRSVQPEQWGRFLVEIFDEWVTRDVGTEFVQMFDAALASWLGGAAGMCIFAETCGDAVALEHTGDVYSCDQRRVSAQPLHRYPGRRGRAELPVCRLQGLLHPHRPADADHGGAAAKRPLRRRGHEHPRQGFQAGPNLAASLPRQARRARRESSSYGGFVTSGPFMTRSGHPVVTQWIANATAKPTVVATPTHRRACW